MENIPQTSEYDPQALRGEIEGIRRAARERWESAPNRQVAFPDFNPQELTDDDLRLYRTFKEDRLDGDALTAYRTHLPEGSRMNFAAHLANELQMQMLKHERTA